MRRIILPVLAAALLLAQPTYAQWFQNGEPVADSASRKSVGEFGAMLAVTNDPDGFFEQWDTPPSPDYKPAITTTEQAHRGDAVVAVIIFMGCKAGDDHSCDAEVDFSLYYPDGRLYGEHNGAELWKGKPVPPPAIQLGVANLAFEVEEDDPYGAYLVKAVVRDRIAGVTVSLEQELRVVESEQP